MRFRCAAGLVVAAVGSAILFAGAAPRTPDLEGHRVPQNVLEHRNYYGALLSDGFLIADKAGKRGSDVFRYDADGGLFWARRYSDQTVQSAAEKDGDLYMILFKRDPAAGRRFMEGEYSLEICPRAGECRTANIFDAGALDIAVEPRGVWVLEHLLSDIYYAVEGGPVVPPASQINLYTGDGTRIIESYDLYGIRAISYEPTGGLFIEALRSKDFNVEDLGILALRSGSFSRVGGYRPLQGELYQSLCEDFLYVTITSDTVCVIPFNHVGESRVYYRLTVIRETKQEAGETVSRFFPITVGENRLSYVEGGRLRIMELSK